MWVCRYMFIDVFLDIFSDERFTFNFLIIIELGERDTPSPARPMAPPVTSCNCEELLSIDCQLETKELWDKFHDLGTEMIITKTGR